MSSIRWIEDWYQQQCDGDWEHCYELSITAIDNPGWNVEIPLTEIPFKA